MDIGLVCGCFVASLLKHCRSAPAWKTGYLLENVGSILGPPGGRDFGRVSCVTNIIENQREPQRESGICMFLRNACFVHFLFACSSIAVLSDIGRYACCDATADVGAVCLSAHDSCPRCPPLYARAVTPTLRGLKPAGFFFEIDGALRCGYKKSWGNCWRSEAASA